MQKYEWTPEGLQLLQRIAGLILKNGGEYRYAQSIEKEWMNPYQLERYKFENRVKNQPWSKTEIMYLKANFHLTLSELSDRMNRRQGGIKAKINSLQHAGELPGKWWHKGLNKNPNINKQFNIK